MGTKKKKGGGSKTSSTTVRLTRQRRSRSDARVAAFGFISDTRLLHQIRAKTSQVFKLDAYRKFGAEIQIVLADGV